MPICTHYPRKGEQNSTRSMQGELQAKPFKCYGWVLHPISWALNYQILREHMPIISEGAKRLNFWKFPILWKRCFLRSLPWIGDIYTLNITISLNYLIFFPFPLLFACVRSGKWGPGHFSLHPTETLQIMWMMYLNLSNCGSFIMFHLCIWLVYTRRLLKAIPVA